MCDRTYNNWVERYLQSSQNRGRTRPGRAAYVAATWANILMRTIKKGKQKVCCRVPSPQKNFNFHVRFLSQETKRKELLSQVFFWLYFVYFREEIMIDLTISQVLLFRNFVIKVLFLHYFSSLLLDLIFRFALFLLWCHFLPGFGHGLNH